MSNLKVQGNASGAGTTTLQSANTSSSTTFTLPGTDGTNGQFLQTNGSGTLTFATGGDVSAASNNAFSGANTFYNATGQTFGTATSTQDGFIVSGRAGGSSSYRLTLTPGTLAASRTVTFFDPGVNYTVGYRNLPAVGTKTGSYTLATTDVGEYVQVGSGGSITIPDATFAEGDAISIFNNTSGNITITCTITTAYIAGTDSDKASVTLSTRGVCTILFISSTVCVITGNVT
jgi:hypothetical protein